ACLGWTRSWCSVRTPLTGAGGGGACCSWEASRASGVLRIRSPPVARRWRGGVKRRVWGASGAPHVTGGDPLADGHDVGRLGALGALPALELHLRAFDQRLEAVSGDRRVMDEQILRSFVRRDEAVA